MAKDEPFITLLEVLEKKLPESSRTTLREVIAAKRVLVDGKIAVTLKQPIAPNATVEILDRITARTRVAGGVPFRVIHDDADLLVIDKPFGFITSSGPNDSRKTVHQILVDHYAKIDHRIEIGLVHRLDKDASGLIVFSKNDAAFESLKQQFADKSAGRTYHAIVTGKPEPASGTIESLLVEYADGTVHATTHLTKGEPAVTHYRVLEQRSKFALVEAKLETGRKHQIRVHLADQGTPIAGDPNYHPYPSQAPRLMLVAVQLELTHPRTEQRLTFRIDVPDQVAEWWQSKRQAAHGRRGK